MEVGAEHYFVSLFVLQSRHRSRLTIREMKARVTDGLARLRNMSRLFRRRIGSDLCLGQVREMTARVAMLPTEKKKNIGDRK